MFVLLPIVPIPPRPPHYINFFTISLLGRWSSSGSDRGIAHFFQATEIQSRELEEGTKNKRGLGLTQVQEEELCNTLHSLYICRLTLAWISSEISSNYEECCLILTGLLPSLLLDSISCRLVSSLSGVDCPTATLCLSSPTAFSEFLCPTPDSCSLTHFQSHRRSRAQAFVRLFAKRTTKHSVTPCLVLLSHIDR